jgi:hypothetical protein
MQWTNNTKGQSKAAINRRFLVILWYLLAIVLFVILRFSLLITLWYLLAIVLSVILRFTATCDYPLVSFGHCIVCHSSVYASDYPLVSFGHCIVCYTSVYGCFWLPFGIVCPLHCLSFFCLRILLIILWYLLAIVLSVILRFTATSDYPLVYFRAVKRRMTDNTMAKRYQRVIRSSRKAKNDRQYNGQKIPKGNQK